MASIVENIIGDRALQLGSEEFVRKLPWGNSWSFIRVGVYLIFNGSSNMTNANLAIGLCNGDQNTYQSASCVGWCGVGYGYQAASTWAYGAPYYSIGTGGSSWCHGVSKIGASITASTTSNNTVNYVRGAASGQPDWLFADIVRTSSSSYTVHGGAPNAGMIVLNTRFFEFIRSMEDAPGTSFFNTYLPISNSVVMSGLTGTLDTVSVYWNKAVPTIEISAISVVRFY